jgi:hypothetical protein
MPQSFSDEEMAMLRELAAPVAFGQRHAFLFEVAAALGNCPHGPGATFRNARDIQRRFVLEAKRVAQAALIAATLARARRAAEPPAPSPALYKGPLAAEKAA